MCILLRIFLLKIQRLRVITSFDCWQFAAEFVEKTLVKSLMVRLLQAENGRSAESVGHLLTDQVLEVDRQLLEVARSTLPVEISGVWVVGTEDWAEVGGQWGGV